MSISSAFLFVLIFIEAIQAGITSISHDQVQPFEQPQPVTDEQKTVVKFKPQLHISFGCQPYPAVQADGSISKGLKWSGPADGECQGSELGSQVYARSAWYREKFAIMYAWYFPKGYELIFKYQSGHRHLWRFAIVWIDDPTVENSEILGVSLNSGTGYQKRDPPKSKYVNGSSVKIESYKSFWGFRAALQLTKKEGETQDLIMWDQLTDEAREALSSDVFDLELLFSTIRMPLTDDAFTKVLNEAWPF